MQVDKSFTVPIQLPYSTWGTYSDSTTHIVIAFHGYGMLARYFIKKFEILDPRTHYVLAPQGISTFYLEGFSGRVGASWMTREKREMDILNQQVLIHRLLDLELPKDFTGKLIFFGFSQGAATATRFLSHIKNKVSELVLWAGKFPEDTVFTPVFQEIKIRYVTGREDPFLEENTIEDQLKLIREKYNAEAQVILFDGKHEMVSHVLAEIFQ